MAQMEIDLKPPTGTPLPPLDLFRSNLLGPKRKRGANPTMGRLQGFYLNMLRDHDPEYRHLAEELEGAAKRIQDYLGGTESLMATALQVAVPSPSRRRKRVSDSGPFGGYTYHDINRTLPEGVSWQDAAMWVIRAQQGERPAEIAKETGWPITTVNDAITSFARTSGALKLLDKEGRLK